MKNGATGRGALARDGSAVELYKLLQHLGEADIVHSAIAPGAAVLELGCGVGRITHALIERGHPVTAVDDCAEMLAEVRGAQTVCADIGALYLGQRFPCVLLMSCLLNQADDGIRRDFLRTCARHLSFDGVAIFQCHDPSLLERAKPGPVGTDPNGVSFAWQEVEVNGDVVGGTLEYRFGDDCWTQTFSVRVLDEAGIRQELQHAGLRFDVWLSSPTWFAAKLL